MFFFQQTQRKFFQSFFLSLCCYCSSSNINDKWSCLSQDSSEEMREWQEMQNYTAAPTFPSSIPGRGHTIITDRYGLSKHQSPSGSCQDTENIAAKSFFAQLCITCIWMDFFAWNYLICDSSHYQGLQIKSRKLSALDLDGVLTLTELK